MTFNQLPDDWETATLGEIASEDGLVGGPFGSSLGRKDYVADGVPVIRGTNIGSANRFNPGDLVFVTQEKVTQDLRRNTAVPGDIVLTQRGTLGQVGMVPDDTYPLWVISQSQERLRVDPAKADRDFVYFALQSPATVDEITRQAITTGVPHINLSITQELPIPLPPVEEQHQIAWALSSLDDKIESNWRIAKTLEEITAALFKARFVDFVDHDDLVESEIGSVPRGWRVIPMSKAVAINPRVASIKKGSNIPHIGMSDVPSWGMRPDGEVEWREYTGGARFEPSDTLMARITGCIEHGKGAFVDFLDGPGAGSTEFLVLRAKAPLTPEMVFLLSRTHRVREHAIANMSGSSGRQRVQTSAFDHLSIAVPPDSETLAEETGLFQAIFQRTRGLWQESRTLAALRDALLPRLISGEIRVPANKEPAA